MLKSANPSKMLHFNYRIISLLDHKAPNLPMSNNIQIRGWTQSLKCPICKTKAQLEASLFRDIGLMWNHSCSQIRLGLDNRITERAQDLPEELCIIAAQQQLPIQICPGRQELSHSKLLEFHSLKCLGLETLPKLTKICLWKMVRVKPNNTTLVTI